MIGTIRRWIAEPPPDFLFEVSEGCLAQASPRMASGSRLERLELRSVVASPSTPNLLRPQVLREALAKTVSGARAGTAALVIPDYAVRMSILDFEQFPDGELERLALIRFRLRKSVPFHIDEAQVSYVIQHQQAKFVEVLAVAIASPILTEYEQLFSEAGFRIGLVTPSSVAALPLFNRASQSALTLVVKLAGTTVSVLLVQRGRLRLVRSIDMAAGEDEMPGAESDLLPGIIQQTLAYAEDQVGSAVDKILICGAEEFCRQLEALSSDEFQVSTGRIDSTFGAVAPENAGLLGLLEQYTRP